MPPSPATSDAPPLTPRRLIGDLGLLLGYAVLALVWLWPAPRFWATHVAYDPGKFDATSTADFHLIVWVLSWVAHAVWRTPLRLFDANTFYPAPLSLAYSEHLIGYLPLFGPVYWLGDNPILALNLTAFLTYPLSAYFTYLFARRYVGPAAAALCGVLYAFSASRYLVPPHFHLLGVQYFPLILYALDRWLLWARLRDGALLALALLLQMLSSVYLMYAVAFVCAVAGPFAILQHRERLDRRRIAGLGLVGVVVAGALVPVMLPYVRLRELGLVPEYDTAHPPLGLIPSFTRLQLERYLWKGGVGWLGYALALLGVSPGGTRSERFLRRLAVALVLLGVFLSLGPGFATGSRTLWSPYAFLMDVLPGFSAVRAPNRFTVIVQLGFSLLAGLGLALGGPPQRAPRWCSRAGSRFPIFRCTARRSERRCHRCTAGSRSAATAVPSSSCRAFATSPPHAVPISAPSTGARSSTATAPIRRSTAVTSRGSQSACRARERSSSSSIGSTSAGSSYTGKA